LVLLPKLGPATLAALGSRANALGLPVLQLALFMGLFVKLTTASVSKFNYLRSRTCRAVSFDFLRLDRRYLVWAH
jgi:hypothetical protein